MAGDDTTRDAAIASHVDAILRLLGLDASLDAELTDTPQRVAELAVELTSGMAEPPRIAVLADPQAEHGLVLAGGLRFHSLCIHHLLPFFGRAHIGYVPGDGIIGLGAIAGVLDHFARRPQLQERLGEQVADYLHDATGARGVIVVLEARHLCMEMRGRRKRGTIQSTAARGTLSDGPLRTEFIERIVSKVRATQGSGSS